MVVLNNRVKGGLAKRRYLYYLSRPAVSDGVRSANDGSRRQEMSCEAWIGTNGKWVR